MLGGDKSQVKAPSKDQYSCVKGGDKLQYGAKEVYVLLVGGINVCQGNRSAPYSPFEK